MSRLRPGLPANALMVGMILIPLGFLVAGIISALEGKP
jgi:hypothetical protein